MARGRFISESVAKDLRLNSLSVEAELVYLMTIPHLDRDGLIEGDPEIVLGTVCPKRRQFLNMMDSIIGEWVKVGLVVTYDSQEGQVLWFKGFTKNQQGLRYDRETPSKFPAPPGYKHTKTGMERTSDGDTPQDDDSIRQNAGDVRQMSARAGADARPEVQVQVQVQVQDQEEVVGAPAPAAAIDPDVARVWKSWDANMPGTRTPVIVESVNGLLDDYSAAEIVEAIAIACRKNKRYLDFIKGVLAKGAFSQPPSSNGYNRVDRNHEAAMEAERQLVASGRGHLL
jgi:hypothetical protein